MHLCISMGFVAVMRAPGYARLSETLALPGSKANRPSEIAAAATELEDMTTPPVYSELVDDPETLALRRTTALQLNNAIATIPTAFREVVVLREMEGLSYKEIATVVDAPIGTVMSRLARARAELRRILARSSCIKGSR